MKQNFGKAFGTAMEHSYKNLRDLGGLKCGDSRIKNGMIFRSPVLNTKSAEDIKYLNSLGLDCIVDLRSDDEVKERPDPTLDGCKYIFAPVFSAKKYKYIVVTRKAKLKCITIRGKKLGELKQNKLDSYAEMPFSKAYNEIFKCMDEGKKFIFHCTEGKDRTGICAFLIELALGRNEQEIREQYLLSNVLRPRKNRDWLRFIGVPRCIIEDIAFCETTHDELLTIAENTILEKYRDFDEYLEKEFGVTQERREKWREIYVEK